MQAALAVKAGSSAAAGDCEGSPLPVAFLLNIPEACMTATAQRLLAEFDSLRPDQQQQLAAEILRRTAADDRARGVAG